MEEQINIFLSTNDNNDTNPSILWDTLKAYLRGAIISYSTARKGEALREQLNLERKLADLDKQLKDNYSATLLKKAEATWSALNQLLTQKAEASIFYATNRLFEMGDKPGRLLARLAAGRQDVRAISSLKDETGKNHFETKTMVEIMKSFYEKLYTSESTTSSHCIQSFLEKLNLPSLSEADKSDLGRPITSEEIKNAISSLQNGKTPGPDGYGPEFYKMLLNSIDGPLLRMYLHSIEKGSLPGSLYAANISLILKKGKPPNKCSSYRPISLMNVDSKIFSKILAKRLENYLPLIIGSDQTGFIKNRNSYTNMRKLLNIIQHANTNQAQGLVMSLDAEKAFDHVEWPYLFTIMEKFGLGEEFIKLTRLIYFSPKASVLVNGIKSSEYKLGRSTRQGDPLSLLIFALAIEPLAEAIRSHNSVAGFQIKSSTYKIALYADDVLLFLTSPDESIPLLMSVLPY